mgnify:CR=1 FL=1
MSDLFYTGVGSRDITDEEWDNIAAVAKWLAQWFKMRSGKAHGADSAFEYGVSLSEYPDNKEIYIPWPKFEGNEIEGEKISLDRPDSVNFALTLQYAREIHPAFDRLSQGAKKLHQRNIHQVLGRDLEHPVPSLFLLACSDEDKNGDVKGGTRTAWMLAKKFGVPCFNVRGKTKREIFEFLKPIIEEITSA